MRHHVKADRFFTKEEKERIRQATIAAESGTAGEIATMIVERSSEYIEAEIIGGILSASFISLIITAVYFHSSVWSFVPMTFILFFPFRFIVKKVPFARFVFTNKKRREKAVRERALKAFYEKGLYKTRENTGVLFFLSLFERKVWVLADKGIHSRIHQNTLNRFANIVSKGIREGRACDTLCEAIKEMGDLLAQHYPVAKDDTDELSDELITE